MKELLDNITILVNIERIRMIGVEESSQLVDLNKRIQS